MLGMLRFSRPPQETPPLIIRLLLVLIVVLAIVPTTRPILFRTLSNVASAITAVLLVIWATSLGRRRL